MTWFLKHEYLFPRASNNTQGATNTRAFTEWFFYTYLPSRGYTCTSNEPQGHSTSEEYFHIKKPLTSRFDVNFTLSTVIEFEYTQNDVSVFEFPIDGDITASQPSNVRVANTNADFLQQYGFDRTLQVWESDLDDDSFLLIQKEPIGSYTNVIALHFPTQHYCYMSPFPDNKGPWEAWFADEYRWSGYTIDSSSTYTLANGPNYPGNPGGVITDYWTLGLNINGTCLNDIQSYNGCDIILRDKSFRTTNAIDTFYVHYNDSQCRPVKYKDKYYLDLSSTADSSFLFCTGTVDPLTATPVAPI